MATSGVIGQTTTLTWNSETVVELTSIGGVEITTNMIDSTTFGTSDSFTEAYPGLLTASPISISGIFRPDDTDGQLALLTDQLSRTSRTAVVSFPTALSTATWTATCYISRFKTEDVSTGEMINFSAELTIVGKPTLAVTASTGMSALTAADSIGAVTLFPTFAIGTFAYTATLDASADAEIQFTPTAASHTITITSDAGANEVVVSGAESSELTCTDGAITTFSIKVQESGKSAKTYTIYISNPAD